MEYGGGGGGDIFQDAKRAWATSLSLFSLAGINRPGGCEWPHPSKHLQNISKTSHLLFLLVPSGQALAMKVYILPGMDSAQAVPTLLACKCKCRMNVNVSNTVMLLVGGGGG